MKEVRVITSGYFDPIHVGHLECLELAKQLGDKLIVILNSDKAAIRKKGYFFMPSEERAKILAAIKYVDIVWKSIDTDMSVKESIRDIHSHFKDNYLIFAKGGDVFKDNIIEKDLCEELGIKIIDRLGEKIQSSSELVKKIKK